MVTLGQLPARVCQRRADSTALGAEVSGVLPMEADA